MQKAYEQYKMANVETTDQGRLIIILYDLAIKCCSQAQDLIRKKDYVEKAKKIYKAQDAITELMCSLDMDKGGSIATSLYRLYEYMNWRLSEANVHKDENMVDEVLRHLNRLREAWLIAIENVRKSEGGTAARNSEDGLRLVG